MRLLFKLCLLSLLFIFRLLQQEYDRLRLGLQDNPAVSSAVSPIIMTNGSLGRKSRSSAPHQSTGSLPPPSHAGSRVGTEYSEENLLVEAKALRLHKVNTVVKAVAPNSWKGQFQ